MKSLKLSVFLAATVLISSCSVKVKDDANQVTELGDGWPAYSDQNLSGLVFGQPWQAQSAVAKISRFHADEVDVYFYSETVANACSDGAFSSKPHAKVSLPANLTTDEFRADWSDINKSPMTFYSNVVSFIQRSANRTKAKITSFDETGFNISAFADGKDIDGTVTSINGSIHAIDCRKMAPYSVWSDLTGMYSLQSFDGLPQNSRPLTVKEDVQSKFYDKASGSYLDAVVFPLIYSISPTTEMSYTFGPMDGLGTTQVTSTATSKTYKYDYNGPLNYNNVDITLNLNLTATVEGSFLFLTYTIEIPGHAEKTTHQLTLRKN